MASKYAPLTAHLQALLANTWTATFPEVERVLGFSLPASARKRHPWWANDGTHVQAKAWMSVGWETSDLDLGRQTVVFRRASAT